MVSVADVSACSTPEEAVRLVLSVCDRKHFIAESARASAEALVAEIYLGMYPRSACIRAAVVGMSELRAGQTDKAAVVDFGVFDIEHHDATG